MGSLCVVQLLAVEYCPNRTSLHRLLWRPYIKNGEKPHACNDLRLLLHTIFWESRYASCSPRRMREYGWMTVVRSYMGGPRCFGVRVVEYNVELSDHVCNPPCMANLHKVHLKFTDRNYVMAIVVCALPVLACYHRTVIRQPCASCRY